MWMGTVFSVMMALNAVFIALAAYRSINFAVILALIYLFTGLLMCLTPKHSGFKTKEAAEIALGEGFCAEALWEFLEQKEYSLEKQYSYWTKNHLDNGDKSFKYMLSQGDELLGSIDITIYTDMQEDITLCYNASLHIDKNLTQAFEQDLKLFATFIRLILIECGLIGRYIYCPGYFDLLALVDSFGLACVCQKSLPNAVFVVPIDQKRQAVRLPIMFLKLFMDFNETGLEEFNYFHWFGQRVKYHEFKIRSSLVALFYSARLKIGGQSREAFYKKIVQFLNSKAGAVFCSFCASFTIGSLMNYISNVLLNEGHHLIMLNAFLSLHNLAIVRRVLLDYDLDEFLV